jgi:DNA modification methylase
MRPRSQSNHLSGRYPQDLKKLQISYHSISQLRLNPSNARVHKEKQIQQIARSISSFGFNVPILVDGSNCILAGHGRYLAAKLLGLTRVPVVVIDHLTAEQSAAFMLADNKLTENAAWDDCLLAEQLRILSEAEISFDLEITGFEMGEIDCLIEGISPSIAGKEDPADVIPATNDLTQVCQAGDLWLLGKHRVYCGDALKPSSFVTSMEYDRAAMVFSDPPFNVRIAGHAGGLGAIKHKNFRMASGEMTQAEFVDFLAQAFECLARYTVDGSIHYICMDWRHIEEVVSAGKNIYTELQNLCVWVKNAGGMGSFYRSQHELVFVFKKGNGRHRNNIQLGQYGRYRTNVWHYDGMNSFSRATGEGNLLALHPTVKPTALVADAIMDCSARGDIVLDAFLGSGTTVIAAERTGRICYGLEIDPAYVDTIVRRWQKFTELSATHGGSGRTFDQLEEEAAHARQ